MAKSKSNKKSYKTSSFRELFHLDDFGPNLKQIVESHNSAVRDLGLAVFNAVEGKNEKALGCMKNIFKANPKLPWLCRQLGEIAIYLEEYEAAIPYFERALKLQKDDSIVLIWLAISYLATGRTRKGKQLIKSLNPKIGNIHSVTDK